MDMVQSVDRFCSLANELVTQSLIAGSCATQAHELCATAAWETEAEAEAASLAKSRIVERRTKLIEIEKLLKANLSSLRESVASMGGLYEFSRKDMGGRSVFADLQTLSYGVQAWVRASLAFLIMDDTAATGLTSELVNARNDLATSFPLTLSGGIELQQQISIVRSILLQNFVSFSELQVKSKKAPPEDSVFTMAGDSVLINELTEEDRTSSEWALICGFSNDTFLNRTSRTKPGETWRVVEGPPQRYRVHIEDLPVKYRGSKKQREERLQAMKG